MQKNTNWMYKYPNHGYTINRKNHRQQEAQKIDSKILHIELLSGNLKFL